MKQAILLLILLTTMLGCGGCNSKPNDPLANFKPNKAELGEDWGQFKHDSSFSCMNFEGDRPREHRATPESARVFFDGEVTAEEHQIVNGGLTDMLGACRQNTNQWSPENIWTRFQYFQEPKEFKVILRPSNYTLQEGEAAGCGGIIVGAHGTFTAAGTVCGLNDRVGGSAPGSKGGIYIVVAKQSPEQLARTECKTLMRDAVRHEAEHVWLTNDPNLYFSRANDGYNGNHPYCLGIR